MQKPFSQTYILEMQCTDYTTQRKLTATAELLTFNECCYYYSLFPLSSQVPELQESQTSLLEGLSPKQASEEPKKSWQNS